MDFERIRRMGGQELNLLAAEEIMNWHMDGDCWRSSDGASTRRVADWYPSGDPGQVEELMTVIEAQGLADSYALALCRLLELSPPLADPGDLYRLVNATPKARTAAAVLAVLGG